ncbi:interleukin-10 receptor subunit beta-like [Brachyhypopomus gauderio]|uniref:interleukin-10 receptor subunit beta-like n=1 Tax=Brachyhypopomus gauderio TaxID=698409 RepID=UPI0040415FB7
MSSRVGYRFFGLDATMLLLLSVLVHSSVSLLADRLPPPENVTIKSYNLGLVLEWDPPRSSTGRDFKYSAEYKGWNEFEAECNNTSALNCDFTNNITPFGTYTFRVRTELEEESSVWVETEAIALDKITVIGRPDVRLLSRRGEIEVDITDPVLRKSDINNVFSMVSYDIHYWTSIESKRVLRREQRKVMLQDLKPNVQYCVEVKLILDDNKTSWPSNVTCALNTDNDEIKPWHIAVVLVASFFITAFTVILIFLVVMCGYIGLRYLRPQPKLPEHFKQYFSDLPRSPIFLALQNSCQPEELYHEVSVVAEQDVSPAHLDLQQTEHLKLNTPLNPRSDLDERSAGVIGRGDTQHNTFTAGKTEEPFQY